MSWLSSLTGILFVGHSLFGPTNPDMIADLLPEVPVTAQIVNGAPLKYNWESAERAEVNAREVLPEGRYNVVILTEAVPLDEHLKWSQPTDYAGRYYDLAIAANPETRVFLQEVWHSVNGDKGDAPDPARWRARIEADLPKWQGIADAVNADRDGPPMQLLPAGQALGRLYDEIAAGTVPGLTGIEQILGDGIHPDNIGFYYLSMVQYAVITGESPVGLPRELRDRWGGDFVAPSPELANALQRVAWAAVRNIEVPAAPEPVATPVTAPEPEAARVVEPVTQVAPAPPPTDPDGPVPMAIGLAGVNDWSVQQPFLDVMKTARPWIGHLPGQWGGASHEDLDEADYLDADGWPVEIPRELASIGTLVLTDLPEEAADLAGRYRLRFDGQGVIEVGGRAKNVRYGKNEIRFDFAPGPGHVDIRIQRTHRKGDYVRNITVVKEEHARLFDAGAMFNPLWLDRLQGFAALRFMDWMKTNESDQAGWDTRPQPDDYTYALQGVPVEVMLELANRTGADPWFNMPHAADDDYVRRFAEMVRDQLWIEQKAYVEYSNEVWNWQFPQANWADAAAKARWGENEAWIEFYGGRAAEMAQIWSAVYGPEAEARLVNVIATQTGWQGLENRLLNAPLWVAEETGRKPPFAYFDAYAITGYFGAILGLERHQPIVKAWIADSRAQARAAAEAQGMSGAALEAFVTAHQYDAASALAGAELRDGLVSGDTSDNIVRLVNEIIPYHHAVAEKHGLDLIMYEGGSHVVGIGPAMVDDVELTAFLTHFNYSPEMGALYRELIAGWHAMGGTLFNVYADVYKPTKWGSWGALRYLSDDNPRWQALEAFK